MTAATHTFYHCQMRPARSGAKLVALVGRVVCSPEGYRYLPNTSAHKPSRKAHPSVLAAIPAWAEKVADAHGFAGLLTKAELEAAQ